MLRPLVSDIGCQTLIGKIPNSIPDFPKKMFWENRVWNETLAMEKEPSMVRAYINKITQLTSLKFGFIFSFIPPV